MIQEVQYPETEILPIFIHLGQYLISKSDAFWGYYPGPWVRHKVGKGTKQQLSSIHHIFSGARCCL